MHIDSRESAKRWCANRLPTKVPEMIIYREETKWPHKVVFMLTLKDGLEVKTDSKTNFEANIDSKDS